MYVLADRLIQGESFTNDARVSPGDTLDTGM